MPNPIRYLLLILLTCALPLTVNAADPTPPPFQEGKDYARLPTPVPPATPDKVEVVEMFWYGCPHCQDLEPVAQEWLKRKPDNVVFVRIPVAFGASWEAGARAYYAAEALGVLDKLHPLLFDAFHQRRKLNTEDELAAFFAEHGVDQDAFRKAYTSFQTETQLRRGNQLAQRYGVKGVPAVIVNGKYDVRSPRIFEVVDFLIAQETRPQG
ncbi:MAG TPA: thiol:disulfide interchange protein DsbA/DsbL [Candidatus Competibacteraceae bacterium]|nr:thiol:disulfide interchange protein DsbA/DsbL [Candidatus Competibacteraceae bacterium]HRZ07311.1 thiol:disulfide interchange protein DsbA/DsbL [Candidatus Competibacteraceae bacterium]HSA47644.1 thiol:disulfide interchange protein DsbA/DsbL [Candidatus Competibacteraceae bacterium]